ncbi:ABC transporter permease [Homoserinimonas sp. OAct 916]|uniref:ABC transporter permease n=1 Tax=Homoserinimonas sp. OAct 916 TaxID=2211450 RepID=UPI000DBE9601|nr:ABC transporter permease [Homoserinimonas sp. OAct 916]
MLESTFDTGAHPTTAQLAGAASTAPGDGPSPGRPATGFARMIRRPRFWLPAGVIALLVMISLFPGPFASLFGNGDPRACDLANSGGEPSVGHPFGFDVQGCDLYANVIYGATPSITIGIVVTVSAMLLAIILGLLSGYYGGWFDTILGRITDVFYGFPFMVAAIVILTAIGVRNIATVCITLAVFSWPTMTRIMRSSVMSAKNMEYVRAAKALGASDWRILVIHILPNAIAPLVVLSSLSIGGIIAGEAGLTYLGVGLQPPSISWGLQLNTAQSYFNSNPHLLLYPSLFLSVTVLAFVLLGDAVRDALDPKLRK